MQIRLVLLPLLALTAAGCTGDADDVSRGLAMLTVNCSRCHAVGLQGQSPLAQAPPFRALNERYPVEHLEEALAEGIVTGHPAMPEFMLEPNGIADVIAYLKSLE